jgi:hypothetical protein
MIKNILSLVVIALLFSCNKDDATILVENQESSADEIKVENGILSFSSKDFLKEAVDGLKSMETAEKESKLEKFYKKGFMPLYPHFKEGDVDLIQAFSQRKKFRLEKQKAFKASLKGNYSKGIPTEIDEDGELVEEYDDDLITDDEFASFLNDEREIIIGDSLYKFTYSGMFSVEKDKKIILDKYIEDNDIKFLKPDASTITRGVTEPTDDITQSVPTIRAIQEPMVLCEESHLQKVSSSKTAMLKAPLLKELNCASAYYPTPAPTPKPVVVDHTANLQNYMNAMGACNTINGFLDSGFGIFGTSKKCYENFDSKYRTKTKFWKEKYLIYNSIGIKVKHQKKGWTGLWRAKSTDEVGLAIKLATFSYTVNIPDFPNQYRPKKLYFFEDKIFDSEAKAVSYNNAIYKPEKPDIPFLNDVTVVEWLDDRIGYDLTVEKARNLFYTGAWAGAKAIVKSEKGKEVKRVVHVLYTATKVIVTYADLENRKLNTKKIVNRFDFNFGIGFKFTVDVDANGHYNTNINGWGDIPKHIQIPKLYDYKEVEIDFVGVSRKGNVWKGSNLKYTDKG